MNPLKIRTLGSLTLGLCLSAPVLAGMPIHGSIVADKTQKHTWQSLAKLSLEEAKAAALAVQPGQIRDEELEEEDGYLVYSFEILDANRVEHDVLVDAGNGKILENEIDN